MPQTSSAEPAAPTLHPAASSPTGEPGLPPPENRVFYPALDGLRALAVLMVFFEHYFASVHPNLNWGWTGVDLFFVLSGFLITGILFDSQHHPRRWRTFYARRALRIFPLYYAVLLGAVLTTPLFHWLWNRAWLLWAAYLGNYTRFLFLQTPLFHLGALDHLLAQPLAPGSFVLQLGHLWSLCVEEQFYLVWPLVVFAVRRRETLRNLCLLSIPLVLLARIVCVFTLPGTWLRAEFLYRATPLRADALLIGGFLALALRGPEAALLRRLAAPVFFCFCTGFALWELGCRLLTPAHTFYHPYAGAPILTTLGYTLIDLFAAVVILNLLSPRPLVAALFNFAPLRYLGRVSYGFYIFHDMFHIAYNKAIEHVFGRNIVHGGLLLVGGLAFVCTLALSALSYRFLETPFLRLKARFP